MKEILEALKKYLAFSSYAMKIVADAIISNSSKAVLVPQKVFICLLMHSLKT